MGGNKTVGRNGKNLPITHVSMSGLTRLCAYRSAINVPRALLKLSFIPVIRSTIQIITRTRDVLRSGTLASGPRISTCDDDDDDDSEENVEPREDPRGSRRVKRSRARGTLVNLE